MAAVDKQIVRNDARLKVAPKKAARPPGTTVTVRANDIFQKKIPGMPSWLTAGPDHMFIEYDDGDRQIIARGGPSAEGLPFGRDFLAGKLKVRSAVTPARESKDYGPSDRVVFQTFIPNRTAQEVSAPARAEVRRTNRADNLYGWNSNSNSFVGDVMQATIGRRVGDKATPGYATPLGGGKFSPEMERSRAALGSGFGSTAPGLLLSRLSRSLDGVSRIPMLPGY
ncbi:hypothetical protein [Phenylobacterium sp.]|uniref:hypothetical protein n=1 Tax=Phenylobacterium sp. TaxID=1871053 RepID=UPI0030F49E94